MIKTFSTAGKGDITKKAGTLKVVLDTAEEVEVTYEFDNDFDEITFWYDENYNDVITGSDLKSMRKYIKEVLWKVINCTWKPE